MRDPSDLVNRALDAIGSRMTIGSMFDGTIVSEAARRIYGETLRGLLRVAGWSFARKRSSLMLLGDTTGQSTSVSTWVEPPWTYAYAWPADCVRPRWMPWSGISPSNLAAPPGNVPLPGNPAATVIVPNLNMGMYAYDRPARFMLSTTDAYPSQLGAPRAWDELPALDLIEGVGLVNRRVILTDVPPSSAPGGPGAQLVYTYLALEQEVWDELFRSAMVALLASQLARTVIDDPKVAIAERNMQIAIAKDAIREARVASAQELGYPQKVDITPDWIRIRRSGPALWNFYGFEDGAGPGITFMSWGEMGFADGSVM